MSSELKRIHSALISVYHKEGLDQIIPLLHELGIVIYSTGGTQSYIESLGVPVVAVENVTDYPSILGGRVKTLHPKVFGGILAIRNDDHLSQLAHFQIPMIDLVIVDLYPFAQTLAAGGTHEEMIEKIDIGGISLIRAAAKNYNDVVVIPSQKFYSELHQIVHNNALTSVDQRKKLAQAAFHISSNYDHQIQQYLAKDNDISSAVKILRYGENPHQEARFIGDLNEVFEIYGSKELSYNNLLDIDTALQLISEFEESKEACFAVLKHNNSCGLAQDVDLLSAWKKALAGDPVSAFGGILITNKTIDLTVAQEIDSLFYEVLIAPDFDPHAKELLLKKKNRLLLRNKGYYPQPKLIRSAINGILEQSYNHLVSDPSQWKVHAKDPLSQNIQEDLMFAQKCVKHLKSNAIVLVKNKQLIGMGCGQTSRVDACKQAIAKAHQMGFSTRDSVMASEAFFPFPDCVELASEAGVSWIAQPGGSINDEKSIRRAQELNVNMVITGVRHFKH
ncbi:MAG TPA: bifunctional phosphoribosylaminoimidazolecarboxamide formyltransferase/IMP cyclohydrolase [Saprospiraceae bacterium]|nr:bifunctional phosphoribosylaminoimidazolecarboxamide formyltransferase/IMP cyclohydrolase [Saprospiraceae bacterium]